MVDAKKDNASVSSLPAYNDLAAGGSPTGRAENGGLDADALRLAQMGYTQDMQRNFSVISLLGVAFSLANSWFGISVLPYLLFACWLVVTLCRPR